MSDKKNPNIKKTYYFCTKRSKMSKHIFSLIIIFIALFSTPAQTFAEKAPANKSFTVVLDAGHGGKDPGAVGRISREKNINLSVALALGKLIENNCPDTRVLYTRKTDVFIPLDRRAQIANKAKADLFISIHTNAMPGKKIARGTETYTLGMARAQENLDVAKRENSVILVEEDYQTRYKGFDPRSAESYIIFELMQDKYMEQSVSLAKNIQREFKSTAKRADRGVHQAGFLVLRATSMPSVLVELGYITTADEERYLNSAQGINQLANSLYNAFRQYKDKQNRIVSPLKAPEKQKKADETAKPAPVETAATVSTETGSSSANAPKAENTDTTAAPMFQSVQTKTNATPAASSVPVVETRPENDTILFKVQILTSSRQLHISSSHFKGLKNVESFKENNIYKYTYGNTSDYKKAIEIKKEIKEQFPDAFIVAFRNDTKIPLSEALKIKRN